jgi:hypothetical protein
MRVQKFQLDKGKHVVVASFTKISDTTKAEEETTTKTDEAPRPALRSAMADLSYAVVTHYKLSEHKLKIYKITFHKNKDGKSAKFFLCSDDEEDVIPIGPIVYERAEEFQPSSTVRVEGSTKNEIYDQVEKVEKLIVKYVEGDREQPELPEKKEPEARPQLGFFDKAKAAVRGRGKAAQAGA